MASDSDKLYDHLKSQSDNLQVLNTNAKRQYEINEWTSNNKLDTLFFLQILFISLTLTAVFLFLMQNGLLPYYLFGLFSFLTVAFAVIVLIYRARFTAVKRDGRYWNKQRWDQPSK